MGKKENKEKEQNGPFSSFFSEKATNYFFGGLFLFFAVILSLSFFDRAGIIGKVFLDSAEFLTGETAKILPLLFFLSGFVFFATKYKNIFKALILGTSAFILGFSGILDGLNPGIKKGGWLGYILNWPLQKLFGFWITQIIFWLFVVTGIVVFWFLLKREGKKKKKKNSFFRKIFAPRFKVQDIKDSISSTKEEIKKKAIAKKEEKSKKKKIEIEEVEETEDFSLPPTDLLNGKKEKPKSGDVREQSQTIEQTLESFGIDVNMASINVGPTVTQYSFKPEEGVKLSKITNLSNDLALALAVHPIRIEAPIPGKSLVGIEVPNKARSFVHIRELLEDPKFKKSTKDLLVCLGKDITGESIYSDLAKMPHLLAAGSTGSGKTIFLNSLILSLVYKNSPQKLKFVLIDPKRVEFSLYENLPHLLCPPIVDSQKAVYGLKWLVEEMEDRFKVLSSKKSRNIHSYNKKAVRNDFEQMPYIVLIVDELADLMASKGKEVEGLIVRLAQMARAVGIHLVLATQRPSVEVITGLIKANITSRAAFRVASQVDSRTILDTSGAETLLGAGDMLFNSTETNKPRRLQGVYVAEEEIKKLMDWMKGQTAMLKDLEERDETERSLQEALDEMEEEEEFGDGTGEGKKDPLFEKAKQIVIKRGKGSGSLLQRKLRVGYPRAARILDQLTQEGVVGPSRGSKARKVLISSETYFGNDEDATSEGVEDDDTNSKENHREGNEDTDEEWNKL